MTTAFAPIVTLLPTVTAQDFRTGADLHTIADRRRTQRMS